MFSYKINTILAGRGAQHKGGKFKGIVNMQGEEVNERGLFFPSFAIQYFMHAYVSARKRERECAFVVALITLTLDC